MITKRVYARCVMQKHMQTCSVCSRFDSDKHSINGPTCGLCGRDQHSIVPFVPEIIVEFFGTRDICWACRNSLQAEIHYKMRMCLANTPDWALKWALVMWVLDRLKSHFWRHKYTIRDCCFKGFHYRTEVS